MRRIIWWLVMLTRGALVAQIPGPMDPSDALNADWGAWAGLDLSDHWFRWERSRGGERCEFHFPLRAAPCWGMRITGGNFASAWSGEGVQITHELAVAADWNMRLGLGAQRAVWNELGWVQWQPRFAVSMAMKLDEARTSIWCANAPPLHSGQARLSAGAELQYDWHPWQAAARYSTEGGFIGQVGRKLDANWEVQLGWLNRSMNLFLTLIWQSSNGAVGLGCSEEVIGAKWFGHAVVH